MDGKWHTHHGGGHRIQILEPVKFDYKVSGPVTEMATPFPKYQEYALEHVALFGEGIWVGMHRPTLDKMDFEIYGPPEPHVRMILKAILQRDVASELGL